jgi:hypothetical protein
MLKPRIAERILALVTSRDRASSTVGDLMEIAQTRGVVWFWADILRTALSMAWRDIRADDGRIALLAVLGFVLQFVCCSIVLELMSFVWILPLPENSRPEFAYQIFNNVVLPLFVARWIAQLARGREVAACFSLFVVSVTIAMAITLIMQAVNPKSEARLNLMIFTELLPLLAGAIWARRRQTVIL